MAKVLGLALMALTTCAAVYSLIISTTGPGNPDRRPWYVFCAVVWCFGAWLVAQGTARLVMRGLLLSLAGSFCVLLGPNPWHIGSVADQGLMALGILLTTIALHHLVVRLVAVRQGH